MDDPNPRRTRLIDLLCLALLGGSALWLLLRWNTIPARVPGHYGIGGLPDRWTGKASLWSLPAVGAVLYALLHTAEHFPALWNTGVPVTDQNRRRVYGILYGLLSTQKLLLCAVFAVLHRSPAERGHRAGGVLVQSEHSSLERISGPAGLSIVLCAHHWHGCNRTGGVRPERICVPGGR